MSSFSILRREGSVMANRRIERDRIQRAATFGVADRPVQAPIIGCIDL